MHWEWSCLFFTWRITTLAQLPRLYVNPLTVWLCCRQLSAVALKDDLGSQKYERMIPSWNWDFRFNSETFSGSTKIAHSMPLLFVLVVKVSWLNLALKEFTRILELTSCNYVVTVFLCLSLFDVLLVVEHHGDLFDNWPNEDNSSWDKRISWLFYSSLYIFG